MRIPAQDRAHYGQGNFNHGGMVMNAHDSTSNPGPAGGDDTGGPTRRSVIKRAAVTGVATAWAVPTVQTLTMSGAFAAGSPPPPETGGGTITGQVTNATDASPIQGATVTTDSGQSGTTDASGTYTITNVPAGNHSVTASASGFLPSTQNTSVTEGGTTVLNFALAAAGSGAIRAVLSWGAIPRDLDLHVSGPVSGSPGSRFHVYYAAPSVTDGTGDAYCELDVDDTDGNGPETQTISISNSEGDYVAGTYRIWVHNYSDEHSDSNNFATGSATLNLFDLNGQIGSYPQSAATGDDTKFIWKIVEFNVDDSGAVTAVTPLQTMADGSQSTVF